MTKPETISTAAGCQGTRTRVYQYRLLPPVDNAGMVSDQMLKAHRYANDLRAIERGRRAAVRSLEADALSTKRLVDASREHLDGLIAELSAARAKKRTRSVGIDPTLPDAVKAARIAHKEAVRAFNEQRKASRESMSAALEVVGGPGWNKGSLANILERSARALIGRNAPMEKRVHFGTYQLAEAAVAQARKMPLYDGGEPNDPMFKRWDGSGRVGVQIQGGLKVTDIWGSDTQLRVDPEPTWNRLKSPLRTRTLRGESHVLVCQCPEDSPVDAP